MKAMPCDNSELNERDLRSQPNLWNWVSGSQLHNYTLKKLWSTSRPVKDWMKQLEASRAPILIIS
jgi:hypothetical protein